MYGLEGRRKIVWFNCFMESISYEIQNGIVCGLTAEERQLEGER